MLHQNVYSYLDALTSSDWWWCSSLLLCLTPLSSYDHLTLVISIFFLNKSRLLRPTRFQSSCERVRTRAAEATQHRFIRTIIQHVAGVNVQLWHKAQTLYSNSPALNLLRAVSWLLFPGFRSGSVSADWIEIYSFVKNLTDRFVRWVRGHECPLTSPLTSPLEVWCIYSWGSGSVSQCSYFRNKKNTWSENHTPWIWLCTEPGRSNNLMFMATRSYSREHIINQ